MDGIRQVLCVMTLLAYNLIVCYVLSHQEGDIEFCDEVLTTQLKVINCRANANCSEKRTTTTTTIATATPTTITLRQY